MNINNWRFISLYGKNRFVQRTYVFLFFIPFLINTLNTYKLIELIEAIPFSWHMFFYSAVFFTLGTIFYMAFAPSIIKENNSYADFQLESKNWDHISKYLDELNLPVNKYIDDDKNFRTVHRLERMTSDAFDIFLKNIETKLHAKYKFLYSYFSKQKNDYSTFNSSLDSKELGFEKIKHYNERQDRNNEYNMSISFWSIYDYAKYQNSISRFFCLLFFLIGTLLISIVTINSIWIVISSGNFIPFK